MTAQPGSWGGLQVRLSVPEVTGVLDTVSSVIEYATTALEIGLGILRVVRTFTPGQLNLIRPLVEELLGVVRQLVADLRSVGMYAHLGDVKALRANPTLAALKGGYPAWERRWVGRLTDRHDPRRPDFSPSTTVVALFVYTAVNLEFVNGAADPATVAPLRQFLGAFGRLLGAPGAGGRNGALPTAARLGVSYPFEPSGVRATSDSPATQLARSLATVAGRDAAILSWSVAPAPGAPDAEPAPPLPPGGWLVEVCCYPEGFGVGWLAPAPASTGRDDADGAAYRTGLYYEGDTGAPLRVYGGVESYVMGAGSSWAEAWDGDRLRPGAAPVYFYREPGAGEVVREPYARDGDRYYNGRTFFVPRASVAAQALFGGTYTYELRRDALPLYAPIKTDGTLDREAARPPTTVYVRVTAVGARVTEENYTGVRWQVKPRRSPGDERVAPAAPYGEDDRGPPSELIPVTLPSPEEDLYGRALQVAVALALLSRSDLAPVDGAARGRGPTPDEEAEEGTFQATGLEAYGGGLAEEALPGRPHDYWSERGTSPDAWGRDFYGRVVAVADSLMRRRGAVPAAVIAAVRPAAARLVNWRWRDGRVNPTPAAPLDQTVLESLTRPRLDPGANAGALARNVGSLGPWWSSSERTPESVTDAVRRAFERAGYGPRAYWAYQPLVYGGPGHAYPVRALIPPAVYGDALTVLAVTGGTTPSSGWVAWRPFASVAPLGASTRALAQVEAFLGAVTAGLGAVADAVDSSVRFLEGRVAELQELLARLDDYLSLPLTVALPDCVALPLVVNGTEGVVTGLLTASGKPTDPPAAYAGGVVILAGGLPALLTDLILLLLADGSSPPA